MALYINRVTARQLCEAGPYQPGQLLNLVDNVEIDISILRIYHAVYQRSRLHL